jgi:hypothetical protein
MPSIKIQAKFYHLHNLCIGLPSLGEVVRIKEPETLTDNEGNLLPSPVTLAPVKSL